MPVNSSGAFTLSRMKPSARAVSSRVYLMSASSSAFSSYSRRLAQVSHHGETVTVLTHRTVARRPRRVRGPRRYVRRPGRHVGAPGVIWLVRVVWLMRVVWLT